MSRLVDATICPDCRAPLDTDSRCTACGLHLSGPLAGQLWSTMVAADQLVERLRSATRIPTGAGVGSRSLPAAPTSSTGGPFLTPQDPTPSRLSGKSVPFVLLTLGGLCLLVAAVVFAAVAWEMVGLTGRTVILLGLTAALAVAAVALTRRALRVAAETLWVIVAGLVAIDLGAAHGADLFGLGDLEWRGIIAVVGLSLAGLGVGVGLWSRSGSLRQVYGVQAVGAIGFFLVTSTSGWDATRPALGALTALVLLLVVAALLLERLPLLGRTATLLAALSWAILLLNGVDRASGATQRDWFVQLGGWPMLACAGVAAALAVGAGSVARVPEAARVGLAAASLGALGLYAQVPGGTPQHNLLVGSAVVLALAAIAAAAPLTWARAAAGWSLVGGLVLLAMLLAQPWTSLAGTNGTAEPDATVQHVLGGFRPEAWVWLLVAAAVAAAAFALTRLAGEARRPGIRSLALRTTPGVVLLAIATAVLELEPPLWAAGAVFLTVTLAGLLQLVARRDDAADLVAGTTLIAIGAVQAFRVGLASDLLVTLLATTVLGLCLAAVLASRSSSWRDLAEPSYAAVCVLLGAAVLLLWLERAEATETTFGWSLALYAGTLLVAARWVSRVPVTGVSVEACAVVLGALSVAMAGSDRNHALTLTLIGTAACVSGVLRLDRHWLRWAGAVLLGIATLIRVDVGVDAPELYTLPAAILLLGAGVWRMVDDQEVDSHFALLPGVVLALLPSLLIALDEPVSPRGALIATAGVLVLAAGIGLRWSTPFLAGAATVAVLALRHLGPVAEAVPRWISLGGIGLVMLLVGITWEARMKNLESAGRYLRALR